ncbi:pantoate kinase [Halanaeroarchaeum sulfurireducens]|uniref:Pantoate kinase n=1 Tax=Halanaeroarchaeum sulfurireducens TaxID=1604004 RepID=A0A0N9N7V0_9EURY|nr:pantoate kinase [Halanaeroarchaeum sulfurireducens]ALG81478.1 sugar kinase [Halanaeroarchaeum sulfurireducens]
MDYDRVARAFVPGHVTGLFSIHRTDDPATTGSRGAGLTLADGVTVRLTPSEETVVRLGGERTAIDAVDLVLDAMDRTAFVDVQTDLPLGAGFGISGAATLGTALAANAALECGRSENDLVRLAHVAEVEAGTGLGDVVAQARGGVPIRLEPGAPPGGTLDGIPAVADVEYLHLGDLSTPDILADRPDRITSAGTEALEALRERPTLDRFMAASRSFAEEVGLLSDDLRSIVEAVEASGGAASVAMIGRTVFAPGKGLSDAGYDAERTEIHPGGASVLAD